jgi:hypothetical protein
MDMRAKQLLSYHVALLPSRCVQFVSAHVNSTIRHFLVFETRYDEMNIFEENQNECSAKSFFMLRDAGNGKIVFTALKFVRKNVR